MNEFEKKLVEFRKQQKKVHFLKQCKNNFWNRPMSSLTSFMSVSSPKNEQFSVQNTEKSELNEGTTVKEDFIIDRPFNWFRFIAYVLIWITLFSISVYIEFCAIFLILSGFYIIWTNTRTGPKRPNEVSAYSVFNPNCEAIEGTFDAKQLESEIRYGMMF